MSWIAIATAAAVATVPYNASDEAAARAWIAQAGHRFDPAATGSADLAPLVERLAGARVIGIGEATHGTHQDEVFKAELIKALVRAGAIDTVAIECNRAAGYGFDRYVRFGEGDPAALIRSPSFPLATMSKARRSWSVEFDPIARNWRIRPSRSRN